MSSKIKVGEAIKPIINFEFGDMDQNINIPDDQKEELQNLKTRLSDLEQQMEDEEDEERYDELTDEFNEVYDIVTGTLP